MVAMKRGDIWRYIDGNWRVTVLAIDDSTRYSYDCVEVKVLFLEHAIQQAIGTADIMVIHDTHTAEWHRLA